MSEVLFQFCFVLVGFKLGGIVLFTLQFVLKSNKVSNDVPYYHEAQSILNFEKNYIQTIFKKLTI